MLKRVLAGLFVAILMSGAAVAGPLEDGYAAYERGDYAQAVKWLRLTAEQGNAGAQSSLATMYSTGEGVPQDYGQALKWFRLAADQGHAIAQYNLGVMHYYGQGVPQDYAQAVKWLRLAAAQGYAGAQFNLGVAYAYGRGVPQNYAEALKSWRLAAAQGLASAQFNLGVANAEGNGVPQDYAEAAKWYRLAADQGHAGAQSNLGLMYDTGQGVPQDYVLAHMWFILAAAQGDADALENRDMAASKMTRDQIAEAQRLAREWKPSLIAAQMTAAVPGDIRMENMNDIWRVYTQACVDGTGHEGEPVPPENREGLCRTMHAISDVMKALDYCYIREENRWSICG